MIDRILKDAIIKFYRKRITSFINFDITTSHKYYEDSFLENNYFLNSR